MIIKRTYPEPIKLLPVRVRLPGETTLTRAVVVMQGPHWYGIAIPGWFTLVEVNIVQHAVHGPITEQDQWDALAALANKV